MAKLHFYLDARRAKENRPSKLKLAISHEHKTAYLVLSESVFPYQWDSNNCRVVNHPDAPRINGYLADVMRQIERALYFLDKEGKLQGANAHKIKQELEMLLDPEKMMQKQKKERQKKLFETRYLAFASMKKESTKEVYMHTFNRIRAFMGEKKLHKLSFEDITKDWLIRFEAFLAETSPSKNARNIHLRNIRAVFNDAIDDGITQNYPFRRFKIRPVKTRKRNLRLEDLRLLFDFACEAHAEKYRDIFKLMFCLIGINCIDLAHLKRIRNGRIEFNRAKTGRHYSIKVEPEALEIINKYKGKDWLLFIMDNWKSHRDFMLKMNYVLKRIGEVKRVGLGGKKIYDPICPELSTYWARHTWATIAASLDIPRDTIAHALGHGGNTVTDIYIDFDERKVDEANRRVLDWVFYGKK